MHRASPSGEPSSRTVPLAMMAMRGHKFADVVDDVGGQNHDDIAADGTEQIEKAVALSRIESGRRLIDNDQLGLAQQGLCDSKALLHAAGVSAERFLANIPEIRLLQESIDDLVALASCW